MSAPVSAAWRWGKRSEVCLWCGAAVPPKRRRYCCDSCAVASHRADRADLLAAVHRAIRKGRLAWDGKTLRVTTNEGKGK